LDRIQINLDNPYSCFEALHKKFSGSRYLLSLMQHLLLIPDDRHSHEAYFRLVDECATQVLLPSGGYDSDFTQPFAIDVDLILGTFQG
jgi:hypothetical protein